MVKTWQRGGEVGLQELLIRAVSASIYAFAAWIVGLLGAAAALGSLLAYLLSVGVGMARWQASTGLALVLALPALAAGVAALLLARRAARAGAEAVGELATEAGEQPAGASEVRRAARIALLLTAISPPLAAAPVLCGLLAETGLLGEQMRSVFLLSISVAVGGVLALPFLYRAHSAAAAAAGPAESGAGERPRVAGA